MKRWIQISIFLVVFVLLFQRKVCRIDSDIVCEDHFVKMKPFLDDIRKKAEKISVQPGRDISRRIKKSAGITGRSSVYTRIIRDQTNRLFIVVHMGGGFLGHQGYIYSEEPNVLIANIEGMPLEESNTILQIRDQWWSYDSTED